MISSFAIDSNPSPLSDHLPCLLSLVTPLSALFPQDQENMMGDGSALSLAEDSPAVFFRVYLAFSMFLAIFQCVFSVFKVFVIMGGGKNAEGEVTRLSGQGGWSGRERRSNRLREMISSQGMIKGGLIMQRPTARCLRIHCSRRCVSPA